MMYDGAFWGMGWMHLIWLIIIALVVAALVKYVFVRGSWHRVAMVTVGSAHLW